jgi:predicted transcriptional regulator
MAEQKEKKPLQILKERVGPLPTELTDKVKEHSRIKGKITKVLKEGPKTVPEIADAVDIPSPTVLWHVMSMKKYGKVAEAEQAGDYLKYALIEKKK